MPSCLSAIRIDSTSFPEAPRKARCIALVSVAYERALAARRHLSYWIWEVCETVAAKSGNQHDAIRAFLFFNLVKLDVVCREAGDFFSAEELATYQSCTEDFLFSYSWLASRSVRNNTLLYKMVPKAHMADHLAWDFAPQRNPRRAQCYADEDLVGRIKRLSVKCSGRTVATSSLAHYTASVCKRWWRFIAEARGISLDA